MNGGSPYVMSFERSFRFPLTVDEVWEAISRFDLFEGWWPWLKDLRVSGDGLVSGGGASFAVDTPLPHKMLVRVFFSDADPGRSVDAVVDGDLRGPARLTLEPSEDATTVTLSWNVEVMSPPIRAGMRVARPLMQLAHDWAVRGAMQGFRRHVIAQREELQAGDSVPPSEDQEGDR